MKPETSAAPAGAAQTNVWQTVPCSLSSKLSFDKHGNRLQMEENMYRAFQHFDTDNSGTISQSELREALRVRDVTQFDRSPYKVEGFSGHIASLT